MRGYLSMGFNTLAMFEKNLANSEVFEHQCRMKCIVNKDTVTRTS